MGSLLIPVCWIIVVLMANLNLDGDPIHPDAVPDLIGSSDFASKAVDLSVLRDTVVDAAGVGRGLWFSYLFSLFYLAIAIGGITHRDLFLANPVKLPFLNVDLPLVDFFIVGPLILLLIHAYVILHFVLLAGKIGVFHAELQNQVADEGVQTNLRKQLPSNIFIQFLAGPRDIREGIIGTMLNAIAHISLVYGPVILLLSFQLCFLPYHHEPITLWQRLLIVLDLALIWVLWPRILEAKIKTVKRPLLPLAILGTFSVASVLLAFAIATFPGEWLDDHIPPLKFGDNSLYKLLVAGDVDLAARRPKSLWSNRLVIPGIEVLDHGKFDSEEKIAALPVTVSLRARHLEGAVLIGANLRKADFTAAILKEANFSDADLRETNFGCDKVGQGANCTQLQGAILNSANLDGALLDRANLQGASMNYARFQGASLKSAKLTGVTAVQTQFRAALLDGVDFGGALLDATGFKIASLLGADFRGAAFYGVQLQGANLELANFDGAVLERLFIWRIQSVPFEDQVVAGSLPETGPKFYCSHQLADCEWSAAAYSDFEHGLKKQFLQRDSRSVLSRMKWLDPDRAVENEESVRSAWVNFIEEYTDKFDAIRSDEIRRVGCDARGAPYVIRNFLKSTAVYFTGAKEKALALDLADSSRCPGSVGLTDLEKSKLKSISMGQPTSVAP